MSNTIDVFTEIYVQVHSDADISAEVTAIVHSDNEVFTEITVQKKTDSEVSTEITSSVIDNREVFVEITPGCRSDIDVSAEVTATIHLISDVFTEITVPVKVENTMQAKFILYGSGNGDIESSIHSRAIETRTIESELYTRALGAGDIYSEIDSIYRGNADVYTVIQPMGFVQIPAEIEIRPHTNMRAIYEVQKPPIVSESRYPIQDAFTKKEDEYQTINYGGTSTMVIGNNDEFESYVMFETAKMDSRYIITNVKLELIYLGEITDGYNINLHTASRAWYETGVTYRNRPPKLDLVSNKYEVDHDRKAVIFDVTETASKWLSGEVVNNGLVISTTNTEPMYFRTSDSGEKYAPKLVVSYYDSIIPSAGRSQVRSEIFVFNKGERDVQAEIEVASSYSFSRVPVEISVHRPEVPVFSEKLSEIVITKDVVGAEITAIRTDKSEVFTVVTARSEEKVRNKQAKITVSRDFALSEVTARQYNESTIESDVHVSREKILTELSVSVADKNDIYMEITANDIHVKYIQSEITSRAIESSDIFVEIEPNIKSDILTTITVKKRKDNNVTTEIISRAIGKDEVFAEIDARMKSDVFTEITSNRNNIPVEITAAIRDDHEIHSEITIRTIDESSADAEISVSRDNVLTEIVAAIRKEEDVVTEISSRILKESEVLSEIFISERSEVFAEITVTGASIKQAELTVSRQTIKTEITVPFYDDADILTEIRPRILFADDIYVEITMGKVPKGYAFIL